MKKLFYILFGLIIGASALSVSAQVRVLIPSQGGTGIGSATAGNVGDCLTVSDDSPFTYILGSCGGTSLATTTPWTANNLVQVVDNGTVTSVATSSIGLPTFTDLLSYLTLSAWYSTTTDALDEGTTNFYSQWRDAGSYLYPYAGDYAEVPYLVASSTSATSTFSGDLRFDAELLPDGSTCSNGQILKKTGANDWDCAADDTGSGVLSTSSPWTAGQLVYVVDDDTVTSVATTSLTASSPLSLSQPISVIGASASALSLSTAGDWTGTVDGNNFAGGAIGAGDILYGASAGSITELAIGASSTVLTSNGTSPIWLNQLTAGEIADIFLFNSGDVGTGAYDFGGATDFEIPNTTNPTVNATGEVAIETTAASSSLRYYDGTAERALFPSTDKSFAFASSTLDYFGAYGTAGTTTILLANHLRPITLTNMYCKVDTGDVLIRFHDGTNYTDTLKCTTSGVSDDGSIANSTWTIREDFKIDIGTSSSTAPNLITVTATIRQDAD